MQPSAICDFHSDIRRLDPASPEHTFETGKDLDDALNDSV